MVLGWVVLAAVGILLIATTIHFYNRFQVLANRCDEAWSNVDTELKRRHDLIPNLVAAVKGYAAHEREVLQALTTARGAAGQRDPLARSKVERGLVASIDRLLAVAEAYPELKASKNFLQLQQELAIAEDRIQAARRFYNANVRDQRNATRQFPGNLFAAWFKAADIPFFQVEQAHLVAPVVAMDP